MPVSVTHPEYRLWEDEWTKCRDAYDGQRAIKLGGEKYLPRLTGQNDAEYGAYKRRALFYSITSKTVSAMLGMATSKPPILKYPTEMNSYFLDRSGIQFYEALSSSVSEVLLMGRYGMLVDRPMSGGKPYLKGYRSEDILNWKTDLEGRTILVVLREWEYSDDVSDKYNQEFVMVYRVLEIDDATGNYVQTIYDERGALVRQVMPTNTGKPMNYIPFFVVHPFGIGFETMKPPMLDIVDVNISHYCTSADLEHGRHFTGLPTPVVIGVAPDTVLKIGSMTAWILPDKGCDAKYLEFKGEGLKALEKALEEKQSQLASLSARLLDNSKNGSESPAAVQLRYMSETASLSSVVRSCEAFLNLLFQTIADMEGADPKSVNISLDREFLNGRLTSTDILKLTESFLKGGMSAEAYVFNLRRGEALPPSRTDEEEIVTANESRQAVLEAVAAATAKAELRTATSTPSGPSN